MAAGTFRLSMMLLAIGAAGGCATACAEPLASAEKHYSPAKGEKRCYVRPHAPIMEPSWKHALSVRVFENGAVGLAVRESRYPGSRIFFLIAGHRYNVAARDYLMLEDRALAALKRDETVQFAWQDWPYNREHNQQSTVAGFEPAYRACLEFLGDPAARP